MRIFTDLRAFKDFRKKLNGQSIGLVPTMGNLHAGHISLIERANNENNENNLVILSLFINPTQFNNPQDYQNYPKTLETDLAKAKVAGVDVILMPVEEEMYPDGYQYRIHSEANIGKVMEGSARPGHFEGMMTVVLKLLLLCQANRAYFSEKDYQQLELIKGLTNAFLIDTEIVACPIIRLPSGLPLSSRNSRFTPKQLEKAEEFAYLSRSHEDVSTLKTSLLQNDIQIDYIEEHFGRRYLAVHVEGVRLIDNFPLEDIIQR
jgi:pantoate--beta-alanine ligase